MQLVAGLGLSLLGHLGRVRWLAKDVVWVVPDRACGGVEATQAWADTYASQVGGRVGWWVGEWRKVEEAVKGGSFCGVWGQDCHCLALVQCMYAPRH